jgi:hypothetical protein
MTTSNKKTKVDLDLITASKAASEKAGHMHLISTASGESHVFPTELWHGEIRELCNPGQSFAKAKAAIEEAEAKRAKPKPVLARGVESRAAPHSAKAIHDSKERTTNRADAAQAKGKAKSDVKSALAAKKEARKVEKVKASGNRTYKVLLKPADITAREGTWRRAMIDVTIAHKDTDSANAAMLKHREFSKNKIDFKFMANNKYIEFTD